MGFPGCSIVGTFTHMEPCVEPQNVIQRWIALRVHEDDCPLRGWNHESGTPEPRCECLGLDHSQPLLDGDD